jgi:hypothetical protein
LLGSISDGLVKCEISRHTLHEINRASPVFLLFRWHSALIDMHAEVTYNVIVSDHVSASGIHNSASQYGLQDRCLCPSAQRSAIPLVIVTGNERRGEYLSIQPPPRSNCLAKRASAVPVFRPATAQLGVGTILLLKWAGREDQGDVCRELAGVCTRSLHEG